MLRALPTALFRIATAVVLCAAAATVARADGLDAVQREWLARLRERRPELAVRLGVSARRDRLLPITDVSLSEDSAWLAGIERRLEAVEANSLTPARRADRLALLAWCARERAATAPGGAWRRDPGAHLARIARAIDEPLAWRGSACKRAQWVTRRLTAVPGLLRGAQVALDHFDPAAAGPAAARLEEMLDHWRDGLAVAAGECRDGPRFADFVVADTLARRAGQEFLEWLQDPRPARTDVGNSPVGAMVDSLPQLSRPAP